MVDADVSEALLTHFDVEAFETEYEVPLVSHRRTVVDRCRHGFPLISISSYLSYPQSRSAIRKLDLWWKVTTNPEFLQSPVSRRRFMVLVTWVMFLVGPALHSLTFEMSHKRIGDERWHKCAQQCIHRGNAMHTTRNDSHWEKWQTEKTGHSLHTSTGSGPDGPGFTWARDFVCIDLVILCVLPALCLLPISSLVLDYAIVLLMLVSDVATIYRTPSFLRQAVSETRASLQLLIILMLASGGAHTSAIGVYSLGRLLSFVVVSAVSTTVGGNTLFWTCESSGILVLSLLLTIYSCTQDYHVALLYSEQKKAQASKDQLLDYATSGFCEIDVATGLLTSASSKLQQTLVSDGLSGMPFTKLLSNPEDQCKLQALFDDTALGRKPHPILITILVDQSKEIDINLVPYASSVDHLSVCIQTLGEARAIAEPCSAHTGISQESLRSNMTMSRNTESVDEEWLAFTTSNLQKFGSAKIELEGADIVSAASQVIWRCPRCLCTGQDWGDDVSIPSYQTDFNSVVFSSNAQSLRPIPPSPQEKLIGHQSYKLHMSALRLWHPRVFEQVCQKHLDILEETFAVGLQLDAIAELQHDRSVEEHVLSLQLFALSLERNWPGITTPWRQIIHMALGAKPFQCRVLLDNSSGKYTVVWRLPQYVPQAAWGMDDYDAAYRAIRQEMISYGRVAKGDRAVAPFP